MQQLTEIQSLLGGTVSQSTQPDPNKLGQEQFLELFIAQLQNQDPSSPMENGEFLTQIAQFSTASGISELQQGFVSLSDSLSRNKLADASALLSREVLHNTSSFALNDASDISGQLSMPAYASEVNIHIRNANGATVATIDLGPQAPGNNNFTWNGETAAGDRANPGSYNMVATAVIGGIERSVPVQMYSRVESAAIDPKTGSVELQLEGGELLAMSDVREFK